MIAMPPQQQDDR